MKTSIIILTCNGLPLTRACIESIRLYTPPQPYEIIVVDNGSTDGTAEWLGQQEDVLLIVNRENRGFPAGCNQGLAAASGDYLLLLNNDTVVTPRWLTQLLACLDSDSRIGAVGPVTNSASYYSAISVSYRSLEEMTSFADRYNVTDSSKWFERLKLIGFCLLMKREAYNAAGQLDEQFTPGNFEDDDYCLRIGEAGYRVMLCGDTFIHHEGSGTFGRDPEGFSRSLQINAKKFARKWGFDPLYSFNIRYDVLSWLDEATDRPLKVLEVGCACGATLLEIRNLYPHAEVYGLELNPRAAATASRVSRTDCGNIESAKLDLAENFFDYILFGDVLEHLKEPWDVLRQVSRLLKPAGYVLASIPNVGHYSVVRDLLHGRWTYTDRGLLDITHLRFFTLESIGRLFTVSGLGNTQMRTVQVAPSKEEEEWMERMCQLYGDRMKNQWMAYQYLVKAGKSSLSAAAPTSAAYPAFKRALRRLEWDLTPDASRQELLSLWGNEAVRMEDAARFLERDSAKPDETARKLAQLLAEAGLISSASAFLSEVSGGSGGKRGDDDESS